MFQIIMLVFVINLQSVFTVSCTCFLFSVYQAEDFLQDRTEQLLEQHNGQIR